jgi:hypothetical protein
MNFAEQLAYWYLRLNGFIPLTNFVLHSESQDVDSKRHRTSEADLLAVRFPHVREVVGGLPEDWDRQRFDDWGIDFNRTVGLIVEVKSGRWSDRDLRSRQWHISRGVQRLGMFTEGVAEEVFRDLNGRCRVERGDYVIAKLLVGSERRNHRSWLYLDLRDGVRFIAARMDKYERKAKDRMFFNGDLIQFLAWGGARDVLGAQPVGADGAGRRG